MLHAAKEEVDLTFKCFIEIRCVFYKLMIITKGIRWVEFDYVLNTIDWNLAVKKVVIVLIEPQLFFDFGAYQVISCL